MFSLNTHFGCFDFFVCCYFFSLILLFKMEREWSRMCFSSQVCLIVFWLSSELSNRNAIVGERGPETCVEKENKKMRRQREHGATSNATLLILDSESIMNVSVPKAHTSNGIHLPNLNPTKSLHHMKDELCLEKYNTGSIHLPWTLLSLLACNRVSPIFAGRPEWHHIWDVINMIGQPWGGPYEIALEIWAWGQGSTIL